MLDQDVEIGMKVVPHDKTVGGYPRLHESYIWGKGRPQGFLYVIERNEDPSCWVLDYAKDAPGGDFFHASDFEPYIPNA